jgi:DNA repair protein RecN (Recombination protein N)
MRAREAAAADYLERAAALSRERRRAAPAFSRQVEGLLAELAMEKTRFDVHFSDPLPEGEWTPEGIDRGEFYVSPNPGEDLRPLARIVSGGELSRVMLALKTLMATTRFGLSDASGRPPSAGAPGLIFDEVDAGIGGRVADVVGRKLRGLGSAFQVLCITHMPQIAAYADTHFLIDKRVEDGRTRTTVVRLDETGRVEELSRMLGGTTISAGLRESAREMLEERRQKTSARAKAKDEAHAKGESESPGRAKAKGAARPASRKPSH